MMKIVRWHAGWLVSLCILTSLPAKAELQGCDAKLHHYVQSQTKLANTILGLEALTVLPPAILFASESLKHFGKIPASVRRSVQALTSETAYAWAGAPLALSLIAFATDLDSFIEPELMYVFLDGSLMTAGSERADEYHARFADFVNSLIFGRLNTWTGAHKDLRKLLMDRHISGEELSLTLSDLRASQALCKTSGKLRSSNALLIAIIHGVANLRADRAQTSDSNFAGY